MTGLEKMKSQILEEAKPLPEKSLQMLKNRQMQ